MLSEIITVTTTATSIRQLIATARSLDLDVAADAAKVPAKCIGVKLRYVAAETATITLEDPDSITGAIVLAAQTEALVNTSFNTFSLAKALLKTSSGSVSVHVVVEQKLT